MFVSIISQSFFVVGRGLSHIPSTHLSLVLFHPTQKVHFIHHALFMFSWFHPPTEFTVVKKKTILFVPISTVIFMW